MSTRSLFLLLAALAFCQPAKAQQPASGAISRAPAPEAVEPVDPSFVPTVESKAQALEVLSVTRREHFVRIRLKNSSDKNINGFRMRYHKSGAATLFSFVVSDLAAALGPGEVYKYDSPFAPNSSLGREPLVFEAVIFEDGTGEGDADKVKSLQDIFLTSRKELEHVIALLQASLSSPNIETTEGLRDLQMKVSETPEYLNVAALNGIVGLTLPTWKGHAMSVIADIQRNKYDGSGTSTRDELVKLNERFTKSLARYPRPL